MAARLRIRRAGLGDVGPLAGLVGELLAEIMALVKAPLFQFDQAQCVQRFGDFLAQGQYVALAAWDRDGGAQGLVTLTETQALYAEGTFGIIPEFYVRPPWRSLGVGRELLGEAMAFGRARGWKRLEVTSPPLPEFTRTLAFYQREGFVISGGRKLRFGL